MMPKYGLVLSVLIISLIETAIGSDVTDINMALKQSGTGFFITTNGYFLSNVHVIKEALKITITVGNQTYAADVIRTDTANDIALMKVKGAFSCLPVTDSRAVSLGDSVFTIGFPNPDIQGTAPKLTRGEISSLSGIQDDPRLFQVSVPIQPGNSGGPLLDEKGNVIGITTASLSALGMILERGSVPQNVNYAIKSAYCLLMLDTMNNVKESMPATHNNKLQFQDIVKESERAIGLISVYKEKSQENSADVNIAESKGQGEETLWRKLRAGTLSIPECRELLIGKNISVVLKWMGAPDGKGYMDMPLPYGSVAVYVYKSRKIEIKVERDNNTVISVNPYEEQRY